MVTLISANLLPVQILVTLPQKSQRTRTKKNNKKNNKNTKLADLILPLSLSPRTQDFGNTLFNRLGNMVRQLSEALKAEIELVQREYDETVVFTPDTIMQSHMDKNTNACRYVGM